MTFSINWTAVSCIIALFLGLWNIFYSWRYEKKRANKEITDRALDMALELWALSMQYSNSEDKDKLGELGGRMSSLMVGLKIYGYPVKRNVIFSQPNDNGEAGPELERLINKIYMDKKRKKC